MGEGEFKNFGIVQGGQYAKRDRRPFVVRQAALEAQQRLVALLYGRRKSRQLSCVQGGVTKPLTGPIEFAAALLDARIGLDESLRIVILPQVRAIAALHGGTFDTGEFDPPTPAQQGKAA